MKSRNVLIASAVAATLAAGCSSGGSGGGARLNLEKTNIVVDAFPAIDSAGLYIAQTQGLFAAQGLHVTIVPTVGIPPSTQTLINGQEQGKYDITAGDYVTYIEDQLGAGRGPKADLRIIAESVGETDFRIGDGGPELVKSATVQVLDDGPQKPSSIHRHVGQRPIMAAGNTDGDLAMLQWTAASPCRTLELVVHHTDGDREYAYDRDPILGSGTDQMLTAAAQHKWTVIDMAADWAAIYPAAS